MEIIMEVEIMDTIAFISVALLLKFCKIGEQETPPYILKQIQNGR